MTEPKTFCNAKQASRRLPFRRCQSQQHVNVDGFEKAHNNINISPLPSGRTKSRMTASGSGKRKSGLSSCYIPSPAFKGSPQGEPSKIITPRLNLGIAHSPWSKMG